MAPTSGVHAIRLQFRQSGGDHRRAQAGHEARGNIRLLARIGGKYRTQNSDAYPARFPAREEMI